MCRVNFRFPVIHFAVHLGVASTFVHAPSVERVVYWYKRAAPGQCLSGFEAQFLLMSIWFADHVAVAAIAETPDRRNVS